MMNPFDVSPALFMGQMTVGLINGLFYAMMSLGVAIIFGMLRIANFVQGAQYMLGAFGAWFLFNLPTLFPFLGLPSLNYWWALVLVPLGVACVGALMELVFIRRVYDLEHAYGLLLTVGLAMAIEGGFNIRYGAAGLPYDVPAQLRGVVNLGFMHLPIYRIWVIVAASIACFGSWYTIERTKLGSYLRAATENPSIVRAFGINVPLLLMLTYAFGVGLAGFAGVLAAPMYQVSPQMGQSIVVTVFAVVVIGGMGSMFGAIVSGIILGLVEGLAKIYVSEAASTVVFMVMVIVLVLRPAGLFGKETVGYTAPDISAPRSDSVLENFKLWFPVLLICGVIAPFLVYPLLAMKILCFALFAYAFNLIFGYVGLLAFGHAAFFGAASYVTAHTASMWGFPPELAIVTGVAASTCIGAIFGWLAIRRQGLYFSMITLGLAQIIYFYAIRASWTHSEDGIQSVPRGMLFGFIDLENSYNMYFFVLAVFLGAFAIVFRIVRSPFGQVLRSVRENEARSTSLGYTTNQYKLIAFTLSAALSGLAGSLKALVLQVASLTDVHMMTSADVLLMVLIGGVGTLLGPLVGAVVVITIQTEFAMLGGWVTVVQGLAFIFFVLVLRKGIVGTLEEFLSRRVETQSGRAHKKALATSKQAP